MAIELRPNSKWWYGRFIVNGKKYTKSLGIEVRGVVPASLRDTGDVAFERSRSQAQAKFEEMRREMNERSTSEELIRTVHRIRTGGEIGTLPLEKIFARWKSIPRRRQPSERYVSQVEKKIEWFTKYLSKHYPQVKELAQVQTGMARDFMAAEDARGVSPKTYNNTLIFLRSCCEALRKDAGAPENPFDEIPTKVEETVFRKPFTGQELTRIFAQAKEDDFIYPIIVTGACTAMRRGDCCLLTWDAVDLKERFIAVKTSKTGETVRIPIFPMLMEVLAEAAKEKADPKFVFPKQATMYQTNPDGITWRVRTVLKEAGFRDPDEPTAQTDETLAATSTALGELRQKRTKGLRQASVRDFHSFRVTWVTLALSAGVPMELVQKVTGHRTAQIVTKHYFQPGKEDFRKALESRLPALTGATEVKAPPAPEAQDLRKKLESMTAKNWRRVRDEILGQLPSPDTTKGPDSTERGRASESPTN